MRRRIVLGCTAAALAALAFSAFTSPTPLLIWNASESAPVGLYRVEPTQFPSIGERVAYRPRNDWSRWLAARGYLPEDTPLLKPVAAVAPAVVCRHGVSILIDGRTVANARDRDAKGRLLPRWSGCVILGPDGVFLLAPDVPDSLDGRYFGPIDRRDLIGRVVPVRVPEQRR